MAGSGRNQSLESPHPVHNGAFLTGELVYGGEHALWRYQGDGTLQTRVYLRDAMGSVIGLMDENGNLIESFDYDAFGNVRSPGGEALPEVSFGGDSRFQGMWKDAGTGLYFVRARYYDARTGRFLSRDPAEGQLERPESFYPYVFANGNPYLFRDPTGLFTTADVMATVNAISAFATVSLGSGGAQRFLTLVRTAAQPVTQAARQAGAAIPRFAEATKNVGIEAIRQLRIVFPRAPGPQSASKALIRSPRSLQKFFTKHGSDFGLAGNWNPSRATEASRAIHTHVNSTHVRAIPGTYRGKPVFHHLDPATGLNVIEGLSGNFISGWRLSSAQLNSVIRTGRLF